MNKLSSGEFVIDCFQRSFPDKRKESNDENGNDNSGRCQSAGKYYSLSHPLARKPFFKTRFPGLGNSWKKPLRNHKRRPWRPLYILIPVLSSNFMPMSPTIKMCASGLKMPIFSSHRK